MGQITKLLINDGHEVIILSSNIDDTLKDPYHEPGKIYYTEPHPYFVEHLKSPTTYWEIETTIATTSLAITDILYTMFGDVFDEKFGAGFYDESKILTNVSFFFINTNPFLDISTPKSPKMFEVGSIVKSTHMDQEMKDEIVKTVKSLLDNTFIRKYETPEDGLGEGIENLILSKWIPQNDLLNDEKLSLFITHDGMGSTTEVAFSNVPALAVPIFGDQMRNARLLERLDIGLAVEKDTLRDSKKFREKILEVLNNDKYKINSIKTAEMLRNRPISSEELLVKHVEFACRFGQLPRLDLASKDMGVIEYYNLDVTVPLLIV
uniref:glucuronosyltransferase n=1 Tax=Strongyloides venezuelensis TaxID=75913 RepID=A0A0K0FVB0_STRVS